MRRHCAQQTRHSDRCFMTGAAPPSGAPLMLMCTAIGAAVEFGSK